MPRKLLILSFFSIICSIIYCQKNKDNSEIDKYFSEAMRGNSYYISSDIIKEILPSIVLQKAHSHLASQAPFVRYKAVDLIRRKGLLLESGKEKTEYISVLIEVCKDEDSGVSGAASKALVRFKRSDFNKSHRDNISSLLDIHPFHFDRIVRLAGFVEIENGIQKMQELLKNDSTLNKKLEWSIQLALSRMGDSEALNSCMDKVKNAGLNDNVVNYLYSDLVYTRQAEAYKLMLKGIMTDEKKCLSSNPDAEAQIICAFKIMELIAPTIDNFPLPKASYGDLEIDDYDQTLVTVRNWLSESEELQLNKELY